MDSHRVKYCSGRCRIRAYRRIEIGLEAHQSVVEHTPDPYATPALSFKDGGETWKHRQPEDFNFLSYDHKNDQGNHIEIVKRSSFHLIPNSSLDYSDKYECLMCNDDFKTNAGYDQIKRLTCPSCRRPFADYEDQSYKIVSRGIGNHSRHDLDDGVG